MPDENAGSKTELPLVRYNEKSVRDVDFSAGKKSGK